MDTSSVPLMMDIEVNFLSTPLKTDSRRLFDIPLMFTYYVQGEEESVGPRKGVEAGLENDFAFNNNVAGASKHVRLGEAQIVTVTSMAGIDTICDQDS